MKAHWFQLPHITASFYKFATRDCRDTKVIKFAWSPNASISLRSLGTQGTEKRLQDRVKEDKMQKNLLCSRKAIVKKPINFCGMKKKTFNDSTWQKKKQEKNNIDSRWAGGHLSTGQPGGSPGCWCWWCGTGRCRNALGHHRFYWTSLECQHCLGKETRQNPTNAKSLQYLFYLVAAESLQTGNAFQRSSITPAI